MSLKYIPKAWRDTKVIFSQKPGKSNYSLAENYRPISLTSFILKTLEKLIDRYIRDVPLKTTKLHCKQHAYQSGKSTQNALHNIVENIELSLALNEYAVGGFIDISGAFNHVTYRAIGIACENHKIESSIVGWILAMLTSRIVSVHFGSNEISVTVSKGCPQGGVLPPLLWCLVINVLLTKLNDNRLQAEGFSDDLATLVRGKFLNVLCDLLQTALNIISDWCAENGLSINPGKTKMIVFTRKTKVERIRIPTVNGIQIVLVEFVKYLGIILDRKLNWMKNIDSRIEQATIALWQCRKAYSKTWGLSPKVLFWIYTTVIRPIITYASFLWNHKCERKYIQEKLTKLQRKACLAITSAWKSTPTAAMEALLNLPPLHIYIQTESLAALGRIASQKTFRDTDHTRIWFKHSELDPSFNMPSDRIVKVHKFDRKFSINVPTREVWASNSLPVPLDLNLFTDGSLINESAGAGLYCDRTDSGTSLPLGKCSSIYMAEMRAIIEAYYFFKEHCNTNDDICIYTDSQAALKALRSPVIKSAITLECFYVLNKLAERNSVKLIWVPGHSGIKGNEKADILAKKGAQTDFMGPEPVLGTPYNCIRQKITTLRNIKFIKFWTDNPNCRQAKNCIKISRKNSKFLLNISRTRLKNYTGVMTGHFGFNNHLTTIGRRADASCEQCSDPKDTAEHYLCYCPAFITARRKYLGGFTVRYHLIKSLQPNDILNYISSTGRFVETTYCCKKQ